jgi:hypothetical protein
MLLWRWRQPYWNLLFSVRLVRQVPTLCNLTMIQERIFTNVLALTIQRGSPDNAAIKIRTNGVETRTGRPVRNHELRLSSDRSQYGASQPPLSAVYVLSGVGADGFEFSPGRWLRSLGQKQGRTPVVAVLFSLFLHLGSV